jgi:glycosyltransferase involved in cell wall biosynthesis
MASNSTGSGELRLAYLISQYPATSHTFISREVAALRRLGVKLDTFSIRAPSSSELEDEAIREEAQVTFIVLKQPTTSFLAAHLGTLFTRPGRYFSTLAAAFRHRVPGARPFAFAFVYFAEAVLLARELRRRGITHVHNHFANSGAIVGHLAARLLGIPWSFTMHGISETDYPAGLLLGKKVEAADFVACVSYFGRAQAMRVVSPDHWNKLHVVRCGLPLAALPKHAAKSRAHQIIAVGRLSPEKGQAGLLEAFAFALNSCPGVELVLVGDGPESGRLRRIADDLGISEHVRFVGRLGEQETLQWIAEADILVVSSFMEGLPIVLIEAMAMGTAVIASRVAGIPELIIDGQSGLLFTPSNWNELATSIRRLVGDDALRENLVERARESAADEFNIDKSAEQLRELFGGRGS